MIINIPFPTIMCRKPTSSTATATVQHDGVHHQSNSCQQSAPPKRGGNGNTSTSSSCGFQMPLHYPRFKKADYERMPEPQLDCLLREYGLPADGDLDRKRKFAMGAFLWPGQY